MLAKGWSADPGFPVSLPGATSQQKSEAGLWFLFLLGFFFFFTFNKISIGLGLCCLPDPEGSIWKAWLWSSRGIAGKQPVRSKNSTVC